MWLRDGNNRRADLWLQLDLVLIPLRPVHDGQPRQGKLLGVVGVFLQQLTAASELESHACPREGRAAVPPPARGRAVSAPRQRHSAAGSQHTGSDNEEQ